VPFTIRQVDKARNELDAPPDIVIVDGGINDVNVYNIVLPFKSRHMLLARTQSTASALECLLGYVRACFPNARIVVTGYYRIVTAASDVGRLLRHTRDLLEIAPDYALRKFNLTAFLPQIRFAASIVEHGPSAHELLVGGNPIDDLFVGEAKKRLIELSEVFEGTMNEVIRSVVAKVGAVAAIPDIPDMNAAFTDDPFLWGLTDDLGPEDEVADARRQLVAQRKPSVFEQFAWERASLGHPNVKGAEAYARAILKALAQ